MNHIRPQNKTPIVRQLDDPQDTATYYVRAFIRDSITGNLIETVDLTNLGSQRFAGTFQSPADTSGKGRFIDITTKVYSDSGYTTQDTVYANESHEFVVTEFWGQQFGSGGGADVDYNRVRRIINEEVNNLPKPQVKVEIEPVLLELQAVRKAIELIDIPENDPAPFVIELQSIAQKLSRIESKKPERIDLSPIEKELMRIRKKIKMPEMPKIPDNTGLIQKILALVTKPIVKKVKSKPEPVDTKKESVDKLFRKIQISDRSKRLLKI